jgi:RNA polymerase sigma-70 factor (ECF subfamily)
VRGAPEIGAALAAMILTPDARGHFRLEPTEADGLPALAAYERAPDGAWRPASLHVIAIEDGRIAAMTAFIDGTLFAPFGLPATPA